MKKMVFVFLCLMVAIATCFVAENFAMSGIFTVTNTNDSGAGSLRQAILDVNADTSTPHIIQFAIGSGVQTITPLSELPAITASYVLIDGTTQPGWSSGNPLIVINGSSLTPFTYNGITFSGANNCCISNFVINGGFNNGIFITDGGIGSNGNCVIGCFVGTDQTGTSASANYNGIVVSGSTDFETNAAYIGGSNEGEGNVISGNTNYGVALLTNVANTIVQNNYIGTDVTGTLSVPNNTGLAMIGSLTDSILESCYSSTAGNNVISGNSANGIFLGVNCNNIFILRNFIGVDASGATALPNTIGIMAQGVASTDPDYPTNGSVMEVNISNSNIVSGNSSHGIYLNSNTINGYIDGNFIGTDETATVTTIGNGGNGIFIQGTSGAPCTNNEIGYYASNTIAYNGAAGVMIDGDSGTPDLLNKIISNSIYNNTDDAIILLNNSNDSQGAPTVTSALLNVDSSGLTVAAAAPTSPADSLFRLDFYLNSTDRTPITEGNIYLGSINEVRSGDVAVQFFPLYITVSSDLWVSAIATNLNNPGTQPGDSSPYSSNLEMVTLAGIVPAIMFDFQADPQ